MLPRRKSDDEALNALPLDSPSDSIPERVHTHNSPSVIIGPGVYELLKGYSEQEVMQPEGWIDVGGDVDDDL